MTMNGEPTVRDHPESRRYEIEVDGERVGLLTYRIDGAVIAFTHAEIDPAVGGQGHGTALARAALDDARARGFAVVPQCPFVADFVARHEAEYGDLVA
jgi:predicted GNAT family acetyltransferase